VPRGASRSHSACVCSIASSETSHMAMCILRGELAASSRPMPVPPPVIRRSAREVFIGAGILARLIECRRCRRGRRLDPCTRSIRAASPTRRRRLSATCAGSSTASTTSPARRRRRLAVADLSSPDADNGYDISDYEASTALRLAADFDELLAALTRARHQADHGPGREPHVRRARVVADRRAERDATRSATGTSGAGAPGTTPAAPGASRTTGARSSRARAGASIRRPASTTCTSSPHSSPT
jgi:hypothetical protein